MFDSDDVGTRRTAVRPRVQQFNLFRCSDDDDFDTAVAAIAHPAFEPERLGLPAHCIAEADTLDADPSISKCNAAITRPRCAAAARYQPCPFL